MHKYNMMTFTWIRNANPKEKPRPPNNLIFGFECKIPISLVYKGPKYKRFSGFSWRLVQVRWKPISYTRSVPASPTNSPREWGGRDGGQDGGMGAGLIQAESQVKREICLLFLSHRLSRSQRSVFIIRMNLKMTMKRVWTLQIRCGAT